VQQQAPVLVLTGIGPKALEEVRDTANYWTELLSVLFGFFPASPPSSTRTAQSQKEELEQQ